jgi:mannose/cellobiose epimerase-like protein (N-acyl-D-glucosamine 2-epimerase family)
MTLPCRPAAAAFACIAVIGFPLAAVGTRAASAPQDATRQVKPLSRAPLADIRRHVDREWVKDAATRGLLDYWVKYSVEPNGFIQENLDRQWKPWGTQREASVNGQGRQLYSMAAGYEMAKSREYHAALTRGMDFLMKMRDDEYGGYYDRVTPELKVLNENKTGFSSFALYSLSHAGRVTGEKKYLDAAMVLFREIRDKMRDGPFIGSGSYTRNFMQRAPGGLFGGGGRGQPPGAAASAGSETGARGAAPAAGVTPGQTASAGAPPAAFGGAARRHGINLHMFEALLGLYEATGSEEVWYEVTSELKAIERLFDYNIGYLPEGYDDNWQPVGNPSGNPGHLFEWASLLSRAVELGADPKFIELGSRNLDLGLKSYHDAVGGLGGRTPDGQPARMLWWPQCEVIKATANYAILHGRSDLWPYFHKTVDLIKREYLDAEHGGWFADYVPGQPRAERGERAFYKGSVDGPEWGAYHQMSMFHDLWRITDPNYSLPKRRPSSSARSQ